MNSIHYLSAANISWGYYFKRKKNKNKNPRRKNTNLQVLSW